MTREKLDASTAATTKWQVANPLKYMIINARFRAKKDNVPFDITAEYLESIGGIPTHCPALGVLLIRKHPRYAASLDRIEPELGYVEGNVVIVSFLANRCKQEATIEQLQMIADFYTRMKEAK